MKLAVEGSLIIATNHTRDELTRLRKAPCRVVEVGTRCKLAHTSAVVKFVLDEFKDAEYSSTLRPARERPVVEAVQFESFGPPPYTHQRYFVEETWEEEYYAILWDMGLGKSKALLDTAARLYHAARIDTLVVLTYNGIHLNWVTKEIPQHLSPNCRPLSVVWDSNKYTAGTKYYQRELDELFAHNGLGILAVNLEAFGASEKVLNLVLSLCKQRRCLVTIDESHGVKDMQAARTKKILKIRLAALYRRIMTGTPSTGSPLDLFSQFFFLDPAILGFKSYWAFRARYAVMQPLQGIKTPRGRQVEVVVGYKNMDELRDKIAPYSSRLSKDDCLDLPDKIYSERPFVLSGEQRRLYDELVEDTITTFNNGLLSAQLAIVRLLRLQQITCGFVVTDDEAENQGDEITGVPIHKDGHPRLRALMNTVEQIDGKCVIWATYRYSLREIYMTLREAYGDASVIGFSGATPIAQRPALIERYQTDDKCLYFVGHPRVGGTGTTLTAASNMGYFNNGHSLVIRKQSEDRINRIGQDDVCNYFDLVAAGTVDEQILVSLNDKHKIATQITGDTLVAWLRERR